MGSLDKDLYQKIDAIRFCLITGTLPFLEVNVGNKRELSSVSTVITDIDVLGVSIDSTGIQKKTVFDCKTLNKTSPINRAFWVSGLMQYIECEESYIILKKKASEAHRLSAKFLNVHLFDDSQFSNFAESFSIDFKQDYCYSTDIDNWSNLENIYQKGSIFEKFGKFINNELPLEKDAARGLRRLLVGVQKIKGEFNPENEEHISIFTNTLVLFAFLLSKIVHDLKTVIDFDTDKESFERYVKYYIWGGYEAFSRKQKFKQAFLESDLSLQENIEPELNEWDSFINLVGHLLESPVDIFKSCFVIRELSFRNSSTKCAAKDLYLLTELKSNRRLRQFIVLQAQYLIKSAELPKDIEFKIEDFFDEISKSEVI